MRILLTAGLAVLLGFTITASAQTQAVPDYVSQAIQDPARAEDAVNDGRRKLAEIVVFAGIKPGDKVAEIYPGKGYWTRVFSQIVGDDGHVYTLWLTELSKYYGDNLSNWRSLIATPHYQNVSLLEQPAQTVTVPEQVDLVFTSQNYHDYHVDKNMNVDVAKFNKSVFDALRPGGTYLIIDHSARAGSGLADTATLHRIDEATVRQEVEAQGFVFDGKSEALRNAAGQRTLPVFDKSIRGKTDQFIYRFRKPEK